MIDKPVGPITTNVLGTEATIDALYVLAHNHEHKQRLPNGFCTYCAGIHAAINLIDNARRGPT